MNAKTTGRKASTTTTTAAPATKKTSLATPLKKMATTAAPVAPAPSLKRRPAKVNLQIAAPTLVAPAGSRGHLYRILANPVYAGQIVHKGTAFAGQHGPIVDLGVWQAVQDRLAVNLQGHRTRVTAVNPSLLTGLVFNDHGIRLSPTHATKGARRYRYYVGQSTLQASDDESASVLRLPAQELEDAVLGALTRFLKDPSRLIELMGIVGAEETRSRLREASGLAESLNAKSSASSIEVLHRVIDRITVHADRLAIAVRPSAIWSPGGVTLSDEVWPEIEVLVELKRCGMAVRLIVRAPGELPGSGSGRGSDPKLVALVAKAHDWFDRLTSGRSDSVEAIARDAKVTGSYVTRVIYVAFLAPDIVHRIVRGEHSPELTSNRLMRMVPLPQAWDEQRKVLGLTA